MIINTYLHSSKEDMLNAGVKAGLSEQALDLFMYACCEVKVTLDVEEATGKARIIAVDNRKVDVS